MAPALILLTRPLGMTLTQSLVSGTLVLTIIWWVTGIVGKTKASVMMLLVFSIFGGAPLVEVFRFPLSSNFTVIFFSFIFSDGIMNSGLTKKLMEPLLQRYSKTIHQLMGLILLLNFSLVFMIPQPFSRLIILGMLLNHYFERIGLDEALGQVLLFFTFTSSVVINMMFIRGDIILNNALLAFAGIEVTQALWIKVMLVPTLFFLALSYGLTHLVFRRILRGYSYDREKHLEGEQLSRKDLINLALVVATVLLWITEAYHGISDAVVIVIGTGMLALVRVVTLRDLKAVNVELLVFITAAFSIGSVMSHSGIAGVALAPLSRLLPQDFGGLYLMGLILLSMGMHMVLGSNLTTLSLLVPSLMIVGVNGISPIAVTFTVYLAVTGHYILPFHNVLLLVGNGKGFFLDRHIARYGIPLTVLVVASVLGIYLPWWRLVGII